METGECSSVVKSGPTLTENIEILNLTSINYDCKLKIFEYLEYADLINIAETSKKLHTAAHAAFKRKYGQGTLIIDYYSS